MKKNGKIEFLRFFFCMCVIFFHCGRLLKIPFRIKLGGAPITFFSHGYIGVEFFFLVSGYFMASSVFKKRLTDSSYDLGKETLAFMKHKIWGIFPYHIVAFAILFVLSIFIGGWNIPEVVSQFFKCIPGMLLLQKFGFNYRNLNSVEWYISAMFIAMMILYPICRRFYSMFVRVIAPFGGLYLSGMLIFRYGSMTGASRWVDGLGFSCVLRAFAIISLGASMFEITRSLKEKTFSENMKKILTLAEAAGYFLVFVYSIYGVPKYFEIHCVLILMGCLALTFSGQTLGFGIFNQDWAYFLGKASLPLYLNQLAAINLVKCLWRHYPLKVQLLFVVLLASIFSVITYFIGRRIASMPEKK